MGFEWGLCSGFVSFCGWFYELLLMPVDLTLRRIFRKLHEINKYKMFNFSTHLTIFFNKKKSGIRGRSEFWAKIYSRINVTDIDFYPCVFVFWFEGYTSRETTCTE